MIHLSGNPFTVVGVTAPAFLGALSSIRADLWVPAAQWPLINVGWGRVFEDRDYRYFLTYGRLRPGVSLGQAQAAIDGVAARLDEDFPRPDGARQVQLVPAAWVRPAVRRSVMPLARLMLAATILLLLLACANVANLLYAVATERRREMAVRAALGASPLRLVRLLLTENFLLALAAGSLGLLVAAPVGRRIVSHLSPASTQAYQTPPVVQVDLEIFGFALVASFLAGLVAGWLPAARVSRGDLVVALKGASGRPGRGRRWAGRDLLVSVQVALSVVLLVVAGLTLRSLNHTLRIDPGFATDHLISATVSVYAKGKESGIRFYQDLVHRIAAEPWARAVSLTPMRPLGGSEYSSRIRIEGREEPARVYRSAVAPGYLDTLGLELIAGRDLRLADAADQPGVVLINEAFRQRFLADREPLGRRVWLAEEGDRGFEIVGVVRDAKFLDLLTEPEPLVYCSFHQFGYSKRNALLVRTAVDPVAALPSLVAALRGIDPDLAVIDALTYDEVIRGSLRYPLMSAEVFSVVGFLGLLLAAAGVFGVMSLAVGRRKREIGIRRAIGARRRDIFAMVIRQASRTVALGLVLGLAAALVATRFVRSLVHGVATTDLHSFATAAVILVIVSFAAAGWPAAQATRVDPMKALRSE